MDFTDKKAVKNFLKDNGIEDLIQLKLVFKNMAGSLLDDCLKVREMSILVTPNTIMLTKRQTTQGMDQVFETQYHQYTRKYHIKAV